MKVLERIIKIKVWWATTIVMVILLYETMAFASVINFDDREGCPPPFGEGMSFDLKYLVNDEYLSQGVLFDSAGGGIEISAPLNPVSPPNVASATRPGPVETYEEPVFASFWCGNVQGLVDYVSITLTRSSSTSKLSAYTYDGELLGSDIGGALTTLTVSFPGQIHSVIIEQGPMAFDNFTFSGLIPEPGTVLLLGLGALFMRFKSQKGK